MNHDLESKLSAHVIPSFETYLNSTVETSIYLSDCNTEELSDIIQELNSNKSSDLPITVVKKYSSLFIHILVHFFNSFMDKGIFPGVLKIGRITPVFKKGDPQLFNNYRPVSIIPLLGKIFEKVIFNRLYSYLSSRNVLYSRQFGFRKNH